MNVQPPPERLEQTVARLIADFRPGVYSGHAPTIGDIVEVIRYGFGDVEANLIKITVH
jgi:hypothetical protein